MVHRDFKNWNKCHDNKNTTDFSITAGINIGLQRSRPIVRARYPQGQRLLI